MFYIYVMYFDHKNTEIALIGAGIMSATLGVMLKQLMPDCHISIYERLNRSGAESSDAWNNAGTGHSAYCELNYTPRIDGEVDISKALTIAEQFEVSKQFWSFLIDIGCMPGSASFIDGIRHMSFVEGDENVKFLHERFTKMKANPLFQDMIYTEDRTLIASWLPLMMEGRKGDSKIACTSNPLGTDVNFGSLTRNMIQFLDEQEGVDVYMGHHVKDLTRLNNGQWMIELQDLVSKEEKKDIADFVFIGAGGGSLILLEKSDIPEAEGFGGFPVGGQWLRCTNPEVIQQHDAKVYGKAAVGAPPMSVPHLDTRTIDGVRSLLFGPYASFSTKFLKQGSFTDLFLSIESHNIWPLLSAGAKNLPLTKYLIEQVFLSEEERFEELEKFYPNANSGDWELVQAGQRVQVIKKSPKGKGELKFGTEIVTDQYGTLSALLGASPGASTSVSIMLQVIEKCFPENFSSEEWQHKIKEMVPSFGQKLNENPSLLREIRNFTSLKLNLG